MKGSVSSRNNTFRKSPLPQRWEEVEETCITALSSQPNINSNTPYETQLKAAWSITVQTSGSLQSHTYTYKGKWRVLLHWIRGRGRNWSVTQYVNTSFIHYSIFWNDRILSLLEYTSVSSSITPGKPNPDQDMMPSSLQVSRQQQCCCN